MKLTRLMAMALGVAFFMAPMAFAHPDPRMVGGSFGAGLAHPLSGWDHLLAMFCIGLLAARLGGSALWALPSAFVASMTIGGIAGLFGGALWFTEVGIAASLVIVGLLLTNGRNYRVASLALLAGMMGAVHGHAHGTEMPPLAAPALYFLGFIAATCGLHFGGVLVGRQVLTSSLGHQITRWAGAAVAIAGAFLIL